MRYVFGIIVAVSMLCVGLTHAAEVTVENGKKIAMDYVLTVDGKVADSSKERGPMKFVVGQKTIIPGLERQLIGMKVNEEKTIIVEPQEGYGPVVPQAIRELPKKQLAPGMNPKVGSYLQTSDKQGNVFYGKLTEIKKDTILVDFNHPMAGKTLSFQVKIVSIE